MNSIINEVEELKELIINSKEFKAYKKYEELLDTNSRVKELVNKYTSMQKEIVLLESKNNDTSDKEKELDLLYSELTSIDEYNKYLDSSKKLNELITNIQKNFQEFFDSLVS
ncbi:MAG: YlbF family regulator [Bacilli bacterium]|nr:YlbF family regulator [Bacilli bacterium]